MDRKIIYPGAIPLENDLLETNRFSMVGLAKLAEAIMGTSTFLHGLACRPTSPASMAVTVGAGEIYSLQNVDDTAYSSLPADTTHSILKQGLLVDAITLPLQAPSANGLSQNYLIQVAYEDSDTENTVLPYYNASNPTQAWHGPNNSGTAQGTVRSGKCIVKAKAGIAATTGTQTTPGPDSGYIGAFVVTVAAGQTELTSANIIMVPSAPFLPAGGLVAGIQSSQMTYARDYGTVNAYAADFTPPVTSLTDGMRLTFLASVANTGASTFSPNGLPASPVYSNTNTALTGGEILASAQIEVIWNSTLSAWVLANTNLSALSKGFVRTVNSHEPDNGNVQLGTAADADIVTSMTDTTAGRVPVVGWEGLGGYALQTTDAELQSPHRLPTRFFIQGSGDADKRFGHYGSGVHIEYGTDGNGVEFSANMFVRADGNIIVEWLQVNADGSVNLQNKQMLYGPLNLPTAADIRAVAVSSVFAQAGAAISDANDLPANTVSFCYASAKNSPGYEATILDVGGLGDGSGYRVQYAICYADGGRQFKFRALNGDNSTWGNWQQVVIASGGDYSGSFRFGNVATIPSERNSASLVSAQPGGAGGIVSGAVFEWYDNSMAIGLTRGASTDATGFAIWLNNALLMTVTSDGQIIPSNYANFDARYQAKGSYAEPDTSGVSGGVLWWRNTATGVITMMGTTANVANGGRVAFPFAFPTKCYGVIPTRNNPTGESAAMQPYSVDTTGWNLRIAGGGTETVMWTAAGE